MTGPERPRPVDRISVPNLDKKMTGLFTRPDMLVVLVSETPHNFRDNAKSKPSPGKWEINDVSQGENSWDHWDAWRPRGMKLFLGTVERRSWGNQEADR